jgi:nucleotide-binding universal stress UspA family protein
MMKITVTLDGSRFAEAAVEPAAQLAREAKLAEVYLVRVVDSSTEVSGNIGGSRAMETFDQALEGIEQEAKEYLQHVGQRFDPLRPEVVVLVGEDVDQELARFATQQNVDIIAMSSHGRSGLGRLIMGSHVQRLMEYGVAPVLVVRPDRLHQD